MGKQVFIVKGSPRKQGNTSLMADAFAQGAKETGNVVTEVFLREKKIGDCLGCAVCQENGGSCIQKDDMTEIYEALKQADVIVLASPVYFYTWTSVMKRMLDRTFAVEADLRNREFYLLSAGAAPDEAYMQTMTDSFRQFVSCFEGCTCREDGILYALDTRLAGDVKGMDVLEKARKLGMEVGRR